MKYKKYIKFIMFLIFSSILFLTCSEENISEPELSDNIPPTLVSIQGNISAINTEMEITIVVYDSTGIDSVFGKYSIGQIENQILLMNRIENLNLNNFITFSGTIPAQSNEITGSLYFTMKDSANPSNIGNSEIYEIEWMDGDIEAPVITSIYGTSSAIETAMEINIAVYDSSGIDSLFGIYSIEENIDNFLIMNRDTNTINNDTVIFSGTIPAQSNEVNGSLYFTIKDSSTNNNTGNSEVYPIEWVDGNFIEGFAYLESSNIHDNIEIHFNRIAPATPPYIKIVNSGSNGYYSTYLKPGFYNISFSKETFHEEVLYDVALFSSTLLADITLELLISLYIVPTDFPTIQSAIDLSQDGDTILVEPGTYYENITIDNKSILLTSRFFYNQDSTYFSNTIIDGRFNDSISVVNFVNCLNPDFISTLNGFTITNGTSDEGGGINCRNNYNVNLKNLIVEENISTNRGGGICCIENSNITLLNTKIFSNVGYKGGGIFSLNSDLDLSDVIISNNSSSSDNFGGGAIFFGDNSGWSNGFTLNLDKVKLSENISNGLGGAIYLYGEVDLFCQNIEILDNSSESKGGAIFIADNYSIISLKNIILHNNSTFSSDGGGIFSRSNNLVIKNSTITNNSAFGSGGGVYCEDSYPTISNSIISNNLGNYGIYSDSNTDCYVTNSTFWNNENGNYFNSGNYFGVNVLTTLYEDSCDMFYNTQIDPQFVGFMNYRLQSNSHCIDVGDNSIVNWNNDLDGNMRIIDGNNDNILTVDIGAYEFNPENKNKP